MTDDSLSSRYYVAEAAVWLLGTITILLRFFGVAPGQPVPILGIELADQSSFPRVVSALLAAALVYFWIEWRNARVRQWHGYATLLWGCLALWASYPVVTAGTRFDSISTGWYIAAIALGVILGQLFVLVLLAATIVRSRREAQQLLLPRIPFVTEALFHVFGFLAFVVIVAGVVLCVYAPPAIRFICPTLIAGICLGILCNEAVNLWFKLDSTGKRISLQKQTAWLQRWGDAVDYRNLLTQFGPEIENKLGTSDGWTQKAVRTAIEEIYSGRLSFSGSTSDEITIDFHPKDGNESTQAPDNWTFRIRTEDRESNPLRVRVTPNDPEYPAHDMELPVSAIEEHANAYLSEHPNGAPVPWETVMSHALNQTIISTMVSQAPLNRLAMAGEESLLRTRLDAGADVNERGEFGWTALLAASAQGYVSIVKLLLESGADPDVANVNGKTALMFAARYGNAAVCQLLLDYHANLDIRDLYGATALITALSHGQAHIANMLLNAGANAELADVFGHTALELAQKNHFGDVAKRLRSA